MRYRRWAPAVLAAPALLLAACGSSTTTNTSSSATKSASAMSSPSSMSSSPSSGMASSSTATLEKVKTSIGPVLADGKGLTLYWYSKDTPMASNCVGGCTMAWPPLTGKPTGAMGVRFTGKFGTVTRPGGMLQATYKGHPLYTYTDDMAPGQTKGNGVGGVWHILKVTSIGAISASAAMSAGSSMSSSAPSPAASSSMSSSSSGGGYGSGY
jgi:predicted lipoprotein with Yx(FWY)xxD motif